MGKLKNILIKMQDDEKGVRLANFLGITYLDLDMLKYQIFRHDTTTVGNYDSYIFFDKSSPKDILKKVRGLRNNAVDFNISELEKSEDDYYEDQYGAITGNKNYYSNFLDNIERLKLLSNIKVDYKELEEVLYKQIFIAVITTMETFLSDTFINLTMETDLYLKNFVESHPEFKQRKLELRDIFNSMANIKDTAKKVMLDTIYHDVHKVKEMYKDTFNIDFPNIASISKLVSIRHDLVHRNGKTKDGNYIEINKSAISELIDIVSKFIKELSHILELNTDMPSDNFFTDHSTLDDLPF